MIKFSITHIIKNIIATCSAFVRNGILFYLIIIGISAFSQIANVGGVMTSDRTFYSDTTYVIYQDYEVPQGIVLTINAGVNVRVNYGMGLFVNEGILRINGNESDSVSFSPNHTHPGHMWKWNGIVIQNASPENQSYIKYAHITDAETAILLEDSKNVLIENSSMLNSQNRGIFASNSSFCYFLSCVIENNYVGIELSADYLRTTSHNVIYDCRIKNDNHNVYIFREAGGLYQNNLIRQNIIDSGNNGIWIANNGGSVNSKNIIEKNIIINNGSDVGYGLFLAHDSTIVANNIFFNNNIAIFSEDKGNNCSILNNSFYQNRWAIAIGAGSEGNKCLNNTFSLNSIELLGVKETQNTLFSRNNILHNEGMENIVVNSTPLDLSINNNYWGTSDTSIIEKLIYDHSDNPERGNLFYVPFLDTMDVSNPISPPYLVKKQLVKTRVRLLWNANQEQDLEGYKLYYGIYSNYSFSSSRVLNTDTLIYLDGDISIVDEIGLTAFDSVTLIEDQQYTGNESPFAFAKLYPYAGMDTVICKHTDEVELIHSSVPYSYVELLWSTTGDGYFDEPNNLKTRYYPGEEDIISGGAQILLSVTTVDETLTDSFELFIIDNPVANAGNDTIVVADTPINIVGSHAYNYNQVKWFSNGDGTFNSDTLVNPIYYPGSEDKSNGQVMLEMIAYSECGTVSDSMEITIEPHFSIEGRLWTNQKSPYNGAIISYLRGKIGARSTQIEYTESNGHFRFEKVMRGNYYIYAIPDTNNLQNLVPGYYANKVSWESSYLLPVDADVYDIDIYLPAAAVELPTGDASISGHMDIPLVSKYNSQIYCTPWFNNIGNEFCSGGLSNVTVFLYDSNRSVILDYTLTNEFGDFYFKNLPYGSFILDAEKPGYYSVPSAEISLSPDNKNETGVSLILTDQKIGFSVKNVSANDDIVNVYPNPAVKEITIPYLSEKSEIYIYDLFGNIKLNSRFSETEKSSSVKVDVSHFSSGLYFGRVISSGNSKRFSFVVP